MDPTTLPKWHVTRAVGPPKGLTLRYRLLRRKLLCSTLLVIPLASLPIFAMQAGTDRGLTMVQILTIESLDKFLRTRLQLGPLEQAANTAGPLHAANRDEAVALLEANVEVRQILSKIGWTARDYTNTWDAVVKTVVIMRLMDAGDLTETPTGATQANIAFIRGLTTELSSRFMEWKKTEIDR
jgi:hypothetical protein